MTSSETLTDEQRQLLERAFDAKVYNQYGSTECLSIASECEAGSMHINAELNLVEFERLDGTGPASGIVVTPLMCYGVPLLRYVLKDLGSAMPGPCACGRTLPRMHSVVGRMAANITLSNGTTLTPFVFEDLVESTPGIVRFQFRQVEPDSFELLVVALAEAADSLPGALRDLDARFGRKTGEHAHFTVRMVDDIPLAASGKHVYLVPLGASPDITSHS